MKPVSSDDGIAPPQDKPLLVRSLGGLATSSKVSLNAACLTRRAARHMSARPCPSGSSASDQPQSET